VIVDDHLPQSPGGGIRRLGFAALAAACPWRAAVLTLESEYA